MPVLRVLVALLFLLPRAAYAGDVRPVRDTSLPVYPVEASYCRMMMASKPVTSGLVVDPFAIPGLVPRDNSDVIVSVVPNTPMWRFITAHLTSLRESPTALPHAEACAVSVRYVNGQFILPPLPVGAYLLRVTQRQYQSIQFGGGTHPVTQIVTTPEGPGFATVEQSNGAPSTVNYTQFTVWARPFTVNDDAAHTNTFGLDHWIRVP